jgi:hypothetical protein
MQPGKIDDYVNVSADPNIVIWEYARWIDEEQLNKTLLKESLDRHSISKDVLEKGPVVNSLRCLLSEKGKFVAETDNDGLFDTLIERQPLVERLAHLFTQSI